MVRETGVQSQVESYQRLKKWYSIPPCLSQHYKVWIKGKVEQSREKSLHPPQHLGVVAMEKGAFGSRLTTVANFSYLNQWFPTVSVRSFLGGAKPSIW